MRRLGMGLFLVTLAALSGGCQNKVAQENQQLYQQNRDLQMKLSEAEQRLREAPDATTLAQLQQESAARQAKIDQLEAELKTQPANGPSTPGIAGIETTYDAKAGTLTVALPGDVLFDSGKAELKSSAKSTLDKIVAALTKDYAGKEIRVEGHTDTDKIVKTANDWVDNLDLSLSRAAAVSRYLESKGVEPKRVATVGWGEFKPKSANKAQNRRVEIVVVMR